MKSSGPVLLEKEQESKEQPGKLSQVSVKKKQHMVALSLVTYEPVGNPLEKMPGPQRKAFLNSVFRAARPAQPRQTQVYANMAVEQAIRQAQQRASSFEEGKAKAASQQWLVSKRNESAFAASSEKGVALGRRAEEGHQALAEKSAAELRQASQKRAGEKQLASGQGALGKDGWQIESSPSLLPKFSSAGGAFGEVRDSLSFVLADFSRGDEGKLHSAMGEFQSRLSSQRYRADDLMATLLLVIEDLSWGGDGKGGSEGAAGSASHFGARTGGRRTTVAPEILRQSAKESSIIRLASVREMLRHYFERYPKEYASILAAALGVTADQEGDQIYLQERLASELVHIGGFALAQKILIELKRRKNLEKDAAKCLLELGYRYNRKKKVLVLGKRTCGSPEESRGLLALLSANLKK